MAWPAPRRATGQDACCAVSTFPSGCGRCRRRRFPAANSSGSISRGDSAPICRFCCWTSRPPRSMPQTARWWSNWSSKRNVRASPWWRSSMTTRYARRSPTGSSTSHRLPPLPEERCFEMKSLGSETIIGNARIVLADRVIDHGWIAFAGGKVAEFGEGDAPRGAEDAGGDLVMPGLIELHTDHLEAHYVPRPKVYWNPLAAVISYDGQLATSGITTVLDSVRVGREDDTDETMLIEAI